MRTRAGSRYALPESHLMLSQCASMRRRSNYAGVSSNQDVRRSFGKLNSTSRELREAAFREVLRHLLRDRLSMESACRFTGPLCHPRRAYGRERNRTPGETVANALQIEPDVISSVLTITSDGITLEMPTGRLPRAKADAAREVSLVFAAINGALGREARTNEIRTVLRDYGKFDSPNFASSVRKLPPDLLTLKGRPGTRDHELIVRRGGVAEAARILTKWSGTARTVGAPRAKGSGSRTRVGQEWSLTPPEGDYSLPPREWVEIAAALALLGAAVVFAFLVVPGQPYLMPVPPCRGSELPLT